MFITRDEIRQILSDNGRILFLLSGRMGLIWRLLQSVYTFNYFGAVPFSEEFEQNIFSRSLHAHKFRIFKKD